MVANQQTLAVYAGQDFMFAPKLRRRLHRVTVPVLVIDHVEEQPTPN